MRAQLDPYSPGGCFIATACYGTEFNEQVLLLKKFRDSFLKDFSLGRIFIENYYKYSPGVANFIKTRETIKKITRWCIVEPSYLIAKLILKLKNI